MVFTVIPILIISGSTAIQSKFAYNIGVPIPVNPAPWGWDPHCELLKDGTFHICSYTVTNKRPSIWVLGDSHAASISKTVVAVGQKYSYNVVVATATGCPLFLPKDHQSLKPLNIQIDVLTSCYKHNVKLVEEIKLLKPAIVVYTSASHGLYSRATFSTATEIFGEVVLSNLLEMKKYVQKIVIVGPAPETIEPTILDLIHHRNLEKNAPLQDNKFWLTASTENNFDYINTIPLLCEAGKCAKQRNNVWLYQDSHHLSLEGAEILITPLSKILAESP